MDNLVALLISMVLTLMVSAGYFLHQSDMLAAQNRNQLAMQEAQVLVTFNQALDNYVKANLSSTTAFSNQPLTAAALGLNAAQGTDVLGQTLGGYVASPYNAPQSWFVGPTAAGTTQGVSTTTVIEKFGLNNPVVMQAFWGRVAQDVAQLTSGRLQGYVYNAINATLTTPNNAKVSMVMPGQSSPVSGNNAWDQLGNYAPTSGVPNPATTPVVYAPQQFSGLTSDTLNQAVGYWVWYLQLANTWGPGCPASGTTCSVQEGFFSLGWAPSCPAGGVTPIAFSPDPFDFSTFFTNSTIDPSLGFGFLSVPVCIPIPQSTYQAIVGAGFNFSAACQSSGQGCTADLINGVQAGYSAACSGTGCQTQDTQNGRGYNPANGGQEGEGSSQSAWVTAYNTDATYLYGTYLLVLPGGQQYSLLWSSGLNEKPPTWIFFGSSVGLFTGNVVNQAVYTAFAVSGYTRFNWPFTVVNDAATPTDSTNNQNYTVVNL